MSQSFIAVQGIARRYSATNVVFEDLWFTLDKGDFTCVIGHSGCGKTTLLNILAGLERPDDGEVMVDGQPIEGPSLDRAVIFQSHALLPWMSVIGNVAYAVSSRWRDWPRHKVRDHAMAFVERVGLKGAADKKPAELSGGMRQRVGIARALAIQPKMLLMDEPFSALDALTRGDLQDEARRICREDGQTGFMITHDVDEAIFLADRILLMTNGPQAMLAEIVVNPLPADRKRVDLHKHPDYAPLRNHLLDFLVEKSRSFKQAIPAGYDRRHPPYTLLTKES